MSKGENDNKGIGRDGREDREEIGRDGNIHSDTAGDAL